jgi:hypothetical protein
MVSVLESGVDARNSQAIRTAIAPIGRDIIPTKIKVVLKNGDSSAAKAALEINEVEFAPLPAGVHDPVIESRIRRLKEGVRSIIQGLPFPSSPPLLAWIMLNVVYITNLMLK